MSFDINDPLGDILSDGSNDSFFEEPKTTKRGGSLTKTTPKKSVSDLFNLLDETKPIETNKKTDDWLGLNPSKEDEPVPAKTLLSSSPVKPPILAKKTSFDNDDELFGNLGFTSNKPQAKREISFEGLATGTSESKSTNKKTDLLESILGPSSLKGEEKKFTFDDILKDSKALKATSTKPLSPAKQSSFDSSAPREGRRGRRSSGGGILDPLGLFSNESKQLEVESKSEIAKETKTEPAEGTKVPKAESTPNIQEQNLPEWLGGSSIKPNKSEPALLALEKTEGDKPSAELPKEQVTVAPKEDMILAHQQKLARSNLEYQNTSIALQQQESQVLMALQLKKYEDGLVEIQDQQHQVLIKQEQQFNVLLEKQFEKQQMMENNLRLQQERINNHIHMLLSQPSVSSRFTSREETDGVKKKSEEEELENLMSSMKQRHHEEMFLLEESYKKQITFLEQNLELTENRLKADLAKLGESFGEKLSQLSQEHEEEIMKYKQKIVDIQLQHEEEIKQIRENHKRVVEEINFEHSNLLENIKQSKQSEMKLFKESNDYVQKLDTNIEILYQNSRNLKEIKENVERDYDILAKAREESLKAKEGEIVLMRTALEKCRASAEEERAQLLGLVRSLETKIAEQNQNAREERWALQQAASTLTARSTALDRESEFNRSSIEREREQLKTLKETVLAEQEKILLQLTEEKLALATEKSRLETSNKLNINYDLQKAKAEMETALQVAKDVTEQADRERDNLIRQQYDLEKLKRTLGEHEMKLKLKEKELETFNELAERKANEGERALFESKSLETKFNEQLKGLQSQLVSLSCREKRLAEEKISLSKERLSLNNLIRQTKRCGLCAVDAPNIDENLDGSLVATHFPKYPISVDQNMVRFRLEALEGDADAISDYLNKPM